MHSDICLPDRRHGQVCTQSVIRALTNGWVQSVLWSAVFHEYIRILLVLYRAFRFFGEAAAWIIVGYKPWTVAAFCASAALQGYAFYDAFYVCVFSRSPVSFRKVVSRIVCLLLVELLAGIMGNVFSNLGHEFRYPSPYESLYGLPLVPKDFIGRPEDLFDSGDLVGIGICETLAQPPYTLVPGILNVTHLRIWYGPAYMWVRKYGDTTFG